MRSMVVFFISKADSCVDATKNEFNVCSANTNRYYVLTILYLLTNNKLNEGLFIHVWNEASVFSFIRSLHFGEFQ